MLRICSLLLCILLAPLPTTARVFTLPSDFSILHRTPPSHNITITIALAQHGVSDLHSLLQTLSNPHSPHYSQWRSKQNVETIVRASSNDVFRVTQWIHASIPSAAVQLHGSDALRFQAKAEDVEHLFQISLHQVKHAAWHNHHPGITRATNRGIDDVVPASLRDAVEMISPIFHFVRPVKRKLKRAERANNKDEDDDEDDDKDDDEDDNVQPLFNASDPSITPHTITNMYNITSNTFVRVSTQAVAEMQHALGPEGFDPNNLKTYQTTFNLSDSLLPKTVIGHNDGIDSTGECTMDTDLISSVAQGAPTTFWMVDEWMYELGLALTTSSSPPEVVSISWGFAETRQCGPTDYGPDMPANCTYLGVLSNRSYVERTNVEFMKLGVRGVTLVASSGDDGAPGDLNSDCSLDSNVDAALNPEFPGSSPYVLSVGATQLKSFVLVNSTKETTAPAPCTKGFFHKGFKCALNGTEQAATARNGARITTGGGFSVYSPRPMWQQAAVSAYLKAKKRRTSDAGHAYSSSYSSSSSSTDAVSALPPAASFNDTNRGFPDVAAIGHNVLLYLQGSGKRGYLKGWNNFGGTSASAPIWGGIITILNGMRKGQNKTTLGMVAPALYLMYGGGGSGGEGEGEGEGEDGNDRRHGYGFTDISDGDNKCTRREEDQSATCCQWGFESKTNGWDPVTGMGSPKFNELVQYFKGLK